MSSQQRTINHYKRKANNLKQKANRRCRICGQVKSFVCLNHHNFPLPKSVRYYKKARWFFRKVFFGILRKAVALFNFLTAGKLIGELNLTTIMRQKECSNCRLSKPLRMFAAVRNGNWIYVERCIACRRLAKPFKRFWKPLKPEIRERNKMTRRARIAGAVVIIPFTKQEIIKRDGLNCYLCATLLTVETATIDHVIPLSKGGFHSPTNVKIACAKCNCEKSNKELSEYLNEKSLARQ